MKPLVSVSIALAGSERWPLATIFEVDVEEKARRLRRASTTFRPLCAAVWAKALEAEPG